MLILDPFQHRDYVPAPPPAFRLLSKSSRYPVHSILKYHPSSTEGKPLPHIFALQGHPEFTPSIVSHITDARSSMGIFDASATAEARRRLGGKDGSGGEGFGRVGWAIWSVILQALPVAVAMNGTGVAHPNGMSNGNISGSSRAAGHYIQDEKRYAHVDRVLDRKGPWTVDGFEEGQQVWHVGTSRSSG